jgi:hypothetical protein
MIHVIPCDESHRLDTTCDCEPSVEFLAEMLVVHNGPDTNGWVVVESDDDNRLTAVLKDGVMVPVEIE